MTTEELNFLIVQAERGYTSAMNQLTHIYGESDGYINIEQAAKWFLALIQKDCDPNSGVYEETGYDKDLYEKIKNSILNPITEEDVTSLSCLSGDNRSLLGKFIVLASSDARTYINQSEEAIQHNIDYKEEKHRKAAEENERKNNPIVIAIENGDSSDWLWTYTRENRNLKIPPIVKYIGAKAFFHCSCLNSVIIPNSVTSIGDSAFQECTDLVSVTIPNSVTSIGDSAFWWCTVLTSIEIPNSVTSIGNQAFYRCTRLTSVTIGNGVTSIGYQAFCRCTRLTSMTIPDSVTSIGGYAFCGCTGLISVIIPNSVASIEIGTFSDCSSLRSVAIPNSVTSIGNHAFYRCTGLTSVTIPNSVTSIGIYAFSGCSGLKSIIVPKGTKQKFAQMEGLKGLESKIIEE